MFMTVKPYTEVTQETGSAYPLNRYLQPKRVERFQGGISKYMRATNSCDILNDFIYDPQRAQLIIIERDEKDPIDFDSEYLPYEWTVEQKESYRKWFDENVNILRSTNQDDKAARFISKYKGRYVPIIDGQHRVKALNSLAHDKDEKLRKAGSDPQFFLITRNALVSNTPRKIFALCIPKG